MKQQLVIPAVFAAMQLIGWANMESFAATADATGTIATQDESSGYITAPESNDAERGVTDARDENKFGVGTAVGAVTGAAIGSQVARHGKRKRGAITGGAIGAATGTYAQNRSAARGAQGPSEQVGGATSVQPSPRPANGMEVPIEGR